jgi:hypothetical protein
MLARLHGANVPAANDLFADPCVVAAGRYVLSTSNIGPSRVFGGYAPMFADGGYALCYAINDDSIHVTVGTHRSCAETSTEAMAREVRRALAVVLELLQSDENPDAGGATIGHGNDGPLRMRARL